MTNNQWDDDKLEKLLHSMPKIEDNRSKELVIGRLKKDQRLKKPRWMNLKVWMPVIVSVAALILLAYLFLRCSTIMMGQWMMQSRLNLI